MKAYCLDDYDLCGRCSRIPSALGRDESAEFFDAGLCNQKSYLFGYLADLQLRHYSVIQSQAHISVFKTNQDVSYGRRNVSKWEKIRQFIWR